MNGVPLPARAWRPTQAKVFKELGISLVDVDGNATSTSNRLNQLADRIQKIENPAKRTETALRIFGEQGVKAVSLLAQGIRYYYKT